MDKERDSETGRFQSKTTREKIRTVFEEVDGPPVVLSSDITRFLDVSHDTARRRLEELYEDEIISKRESGGRILYYPRGWDNKKKQLDVWPDHSLETETVTHEIKSTSPEYESIDSVPIGTSTSDPSQVLEEVDQFSTIEPLHQEHGSRPLAEAIRRYISEERPNTRHGKLAMYYAYLLLQNFRRMKSGELKDELYNLVGEHYASEKSMWEVLRPHIKDIPGVQYEGHSDLVLNEKSATEYLFTYGYINEEFREEILMDIGYE